MTKERQLQVLLTHYKWEQKQVNFSHKKGQYWTSPTPNSPANDLYWFHDGKKTLGHPLRCPQKTKTSNDLSKNLAFGNTIFTRNVHLGQPPKAGETRSDIFASEKRESASGMENICETLQLGMKILAEKHCHAIRMPLDCFMPSNSPPALAEQICPLCQLPFTPHRINQVYCTPEHRVEYNKLTHVTVKIPFPQSNELSILDPKRTNS